MNRILIIEDDRDIQQLLRLVLLMQGYEVVVADTGQEGLRLALEEQPDLVLLDINLPDIDGFEIGRKLRQNVSMALVPIILLTAKAATADKLAGFAVGADDYVTKPFDMEELLARVSAHLRRVEQGLLSELTGLPGNTLIERAIKRTVSMANCLWAILYVDMDNFKAYNDIYGFVAGNELIKALALILHEVMRDLGCDPDLDFVGHIGGDDFVLITGAEGVEEKCQEIIRRFDAEVPCHYRAADRARGYVVTTDRRGRLQQFPLVSVSIAVVTNQRRAIKSHFEVGSIAAEVKKKAKAQPGSAYYVDQRSGKAAHGS